MQLDPKIAIFNFGVWLTGKGGDSIKKKIVIMFSVFILFFAFASEPQRANALVYSKAGTLTAKKIVKEVIQEAAVNQAANMAVLEAINIADKYQAKEGYKIVCPSGAASCDKPVQVKTALTESDKISIKNQSGIELDKMISPGGKGFTKWQSFLDWFFPIWVVTFAMSALTYAIDSDFRNLLNEVGYNALVSLGLITPITTITPTPLDEEEIPLDEHICKVHVCICSPNQ